MPCAKCDDINYIESGGGYIHTVTGFSTIYQLRAGVVGETMGNTGSQALPQDVVDAAMDGDARKVCAFLDAGGDIRPRDDDLPRTPIPHRRAGRSRVEGPLVLARG